MEESFQPLEEKKNKNIVKHHIEKVKKNQKIVEGCQREKDFFLRKFKQKKRIAKKAASQCD